LKKDPKSFLYSLIDYEKIVGYDYDLEAYKDFLGRLGAPHKKLKNIILIAGTKGKGSTAAIINACLMENGYKVGLYTSPHLKRVNERIRVNNQCISNKELNEHISNIKPRIKGKHRARTFFEILTTIAYLHFLSKGTDFTILEVGLGGRLDATNATDPLVSVVTRIGYDHTNLLGTRLSQITHMNYTMCG
jgi:dihydrofolate synthase/folylpolyglutamate synthase